MMRPYRAAIAVVLAALAVVACADILGLDPLVETPPVDSGSDATIPAADAGTG